jgi:hypothetical protein
MRGMNNAGKDNSRHRMEYTIFPAVTPLRS